MRIQEIKKEKWWLTSFLLLTIPVLLLFYATNGAHASGPVVQLNPSATNEATSGTVDLTRPSTVTLPTLPTPDEYLNFFIIQYPQGLPFDHKSLRSPQTIEEVFAAWQDGSKFRKVTPEEYFQIYNNERGITGMTLEEWRQTRPQPSGTPQISLRDAVDSAGRRVVGGLTEAGLSLVLTAISLIVGLLLWLSSVIVDAIFVFIVSILLELVKFNHFTDIPQLVEVWKIMRDLSNMFFIIILLFIAFGTMLRLEHYEWKHLLPKVVFAALAINFSRAITGLLIDVGQVVMLTFVKAIEGAGVGNFQHMFSVTSNLFFLSTSTNVLAGIRGVLTADATGSLFVVLSILLSFGYLVIATTTMATFLGMLVFRIVALWLLLIFSPLAFVLSAFPQGEEYANKWWQQLTSNIIVGPVLAFFLWVALLFNSEQVQNAGGAAAAAGGAASNQTGLASLTSIVAGVDLQWKKLVTIPGLNIGGANNFLGNALDPNNFMTMLMSVTILSIGMATAQELGSFGAEMVKEGAEHIKGMGKWMVGGAFNTYDRTMAGFGKSVTKEDSGFKQMLGWIATANSIRSVKEGYMNFRHQQEHETYTGSTGKVQDMLHDKFNPTAGMARKFTDAWDKSARKEIAEIDQKLAAPDLIRGSEEEKALKKQKKEKLDSMKSWSWMRSEWFTGRTGGVYQKMEEEKGISEMAGQFMATNYTAEQLSKIFRENVGSGNIHVLQALIRSLIQGNNQDDLARVEWLNEHKAFLGDDEVGMRLKSEMENAAITIQTQNAFRDKKRSAGKGAARDFTYERWQADEKTETDRIQKDKRLNDTQKAEKIATVKSDRAKVEGVIFNPDHTLKREAIPMFESLKTHTTFKEWDSLEKKYKTATKEKVPSIATQVDLIEPIMQEIESGTASALRRAFERGYRTSIQQMRTLVPSMGKSGNMKAEFHYHMQMDAINSPGLNETKLEAMLEKLGEGASPIQFNGENISTKALMDSNYKQLTGSVFRELKRAVTQRYVQAGGQALSGDVDLMGEQPEEGEEEENAGADKEMD